MDILNIPGAQVIETGVKAAGTKIVNLGHGLALIIARGGAHANLRKELRQKLTAFARRREGQQCGFHGPNCVGRGLMVMACRQAGYPLVVRCQAHMATAPRGDIFMGFIVPASKAAESSGLVRQAIANEAASARSDLQAVADRAAGPQVDQATAVASGEDRRWFLEHQGRKHYLRESLPAELIECGGDAGESAFACVWQLEPGIRFRFMRSHPDPAGVLRAYGQLDNAEQETVALGFALETQARRDANLKHRAELAMENTWRLLDTMYEGGAA